jgi:PTH1 family peptidyl-tRNA hydrolase
MYLIAGLGNPGETYATTRHNIGFITLDTLAHNLNLVFSASKWSGDTVKTIYQGKQVVFVKPTTFMNLSGQCVAAVAHYYKISPDHIIVIHDDLDLDIGRVKICRNRGHGGHNGLKSIMAHLGTKDFIRIKTGIGRNPHKIPVEKYVLSRFSKTDLKVMNEVVGLVIEGVDLILLQGLNEAMQSVHTRMITP